MKVAPFESDRLRVIDINVWSGLNYQGTAFIGEYESSELRQQRHRVLLSQLKELNPDIVSIHEANKLPAYARDLARELDFDYFEHVGVGGVRAGPIGVPWNLREGDAILARKSLRMKPLERFQLSGGFVGDFFTFHFEDGTQILGAQIEVGGAPVYIFSTHWHSSVLKTQSVMKLLDDLKQERRASEQEVKDALSAIDAGVQWRLKESRGTLEFIRRTSGCHSSILMGDFNATVETEEIVHLTSNGLLDVFGAVGKGDPNTWDPVRNENQKKYYTSPQDKTFQKELEFRFDKMPIRIDFIFYDACKDNSLKPLSSKVVLNEIRDGLHPSDHFGIMADFQILRSRQ